VPKVLLVEDDSAIAVPLARALVREGYEVETVTTGTEALRRPLAGTDLVLLDLGLPDLDGLDVCRRLRAGGSRVPLLMLTARGAELDAVVGLDAGADDYVAKPFRIGELLARVRALLRRAVPVPDALVVQDLTIDVRARTAHRGDQLLPLSTKEFDLLTALAQHAGQVVTRDDLMRQVWHTQWMGSTKTLDMHVSWLRRKLGDTVTAPRYVSTVRGVGFRLEAG
jgi:DNA-binding response OmpR family regulator